MQQKLKTNNYIYLYTLIYSYILLFTLIYSYLLLFTLIHSYLLLFTLIHSYSLLFTLIYSYLLLFTHTHKSQLAIITIAKVLLLYLIEIGLTFIFLLNLIEIGSISWRFFTFCGFSNTELTYTQNLNCLS